MVAKTVNTDVNSFQPESRGVVVWGFVMGKSCRTPALCPAAVSP